MRQYEDEARVYTHTHTYRKQLKGCVFQRVFMLWLLSVHVYDSARMLLERKGEVTSRPVTRGAARGEGVKLYQLGANYVWHPWGRRKVCVCARERACVRKRVSAEEPLGSPSSTLQATAFTSCLITL